MPFSAVESVTTLTVANPEAVWHVMCGASRSCGVIGDGALAMWRVLFLATGTPAVRRGAGVEPSAARHRLCALVLITATVAIACPPIHGAGSEPAVGNVVVHGVSAERATVIGRHAEAVRSRAFDLLFGERSPARWAPLCAIHVHETQAAFAAAVGGQPDVAQGATSIEFSGDEVSLRRIDVLSSDDSPLPPALAHELVHVVLADRFVAGPPPRWADEGLAVLFDTVGRQEDHEHDFRAARRRGMAWSAADLVALEDYPSGAGRQRVFYGQSAGLVRWLIARKGAPTFIGFLQQCPECGMASALERHYGLRSIDDLELAWKEVPPMQTFGLAGLSP